MVMVIAFNGNWYNIRLDWKWREVVMYFLFNCIISTWKVKIRFIIVKFKYSINLTFFCFFFFRSRKSKRPPKIKISKKIPSIMSPIFFFFCCRLTPIYVQLTTHIFQYSFVYAIYCPYLSFSCSLLLVFSSCKYKNF